jgi:benzoyl-CoA reductase/2-hydroxyglutaryl-CoA dehydratase subunit BcrC/BadD/HgdB
MAEKEYQLVRRLEGQKRLGKLIMAHYGGALEIEKTKSKQIAWVSAGAPTEILWAMDFCVQFPEAYAATCGARHVGHAHCEITEAHGYEHHLCTYCRNSLGAALAQQEGLETFEPLAKPDFLLVANSSCILITKWWEHLSHLWNIPLFNIDCPLVIPAIDEKLLVDNVKRQLLDLIAFLEKFTGRKFDYDRLQEIVANGKRSSINYKAMLEASKHDPVPATFFDIMGHNFPNLAMRYLPEAAEHYRLMKEELDQRIAAGIVPMSNIKYRIYWDGIPYWFAIRELSEKLESLGMCLVTSGYFDLFTFDRLDPDRPLESVAENMALMILNHNVSYKAGVTEKIFRDYNLEAGIFAYAQSCKPFSITMRYIAEHVQKTLDVPVTIIEGDLVDETFYDGERNNMKLQALAETLAARKR